MFRAIILFAILWMMGVSCQEGTGGESCSDGILGDTEYTIDCGGDCPLCDDFFESSWVSEGDNLAMAWKELFSARKITAVFHPDKTYELTIVNTAGESESMKGTYTLADSGIENIWTLTLSQDQPNDKTFSGIVKAQDNYVIKVEIVQTEPYINAIAPTPEGGLGSTKTETNGNTVPFPNNVQTFIRQ
ncbi:hypothetical protein KUV50_12245 [Membranicola marinus]|uniref:Uncharacterized protein n=1 Tax=Membranihabitans marinus TaxID=1227546 RepID=A0A953HQC3_9BACT|nr:hypothetical protein [Membranihabitans marinus]MBY5958913.1 hypothetical protein [Membranihabitans marinus]